MTEKEQLEWQRNIIREELLEERDGKDESRQDN